MESRVRGALELLYSRDAKVRKVDIAKVNMRAVQQITVLFELGGLRVRTWTSNSGKWSLTNTSSMVFPKRGNITYDQADFQLDANGHFDMQAVIDHIQATDDICRIKVFGFDAAAPEYYEWRSFDLFKRVPKNSASAWIGALQKIRIRNAVRDMFTKFGIHDDVAQHISHLAGIA